MKDSKLNMLKVFLNIFGVISILLFGSLFVLTSFDAPVMQNGGALRFLRWDILSKHVELMIEIVYLVWGIFMLLAARILPITFHSSTLRSGQISPMGC